MHNGDPDAYARSLGLGQADGFEARPTLRKGGGIPRWRPQPVGYGRPPRGHQFKPGQSGNPKGRPKGSRNLRKAVEEIFTGRLNLHEGNKVRRVTKLEGVLLRQLNEALKGDHKAGQAIVRTAKELGLLEARPEKLGLGDLSSFTAEELTEFERLLEKANAKIR